MSTCLKRAIDLVAAGAGLLILWPVRLVVAVVILVCEGAPVLFRQMRPGWKEKPFELLKFRTMRDTLGPDGEPLPDGERLTGVGRFIRKLSLDELPQLWNVLWGDMSLVGPRPLLMEYLDRYNDEQRRRHDVRPGITGGAQVNGRNLVDWPERFRMDVWYVDNWSLGLDLKILWMTFLTVLKREGISAAGAATMGKFMGNHPGPTAEEGSADSADDADSE